MAKAAKTKGKDDKKKGAKTAKPAAKAPAKAAAKAPAKAAKPVAKPLAKATKPAKAPVKAAKPAKITKAPVKAPVKAAVKTAAKAPAKVAAKPAAKPAKVAPKAAAKPVPAKAAAPAKPVAAKAPVKAPAKPAPVAKPAAPVKAVAAAKAAVAPAKIDPPKVEVRKPEPKKAPTGVKLQPVRQINPLEPPANPNALIHGQKPYIAKPGEMYMSDGQLDHFRRILFAWKQELMEEVDRTVHHMQDESANLPDPNDRATQEEEFALELRTRDRERKLIKKIDKTLTIIGDGDYGYCQACGIEIGIRRLEARPTAELCIDCKTLAEIKEKQVGSGS